MNVGRGTVRAYLKGLQDISLVSGATEHTYREPLVKFLVAASKDLGLGTVDVHGELRLASVGQPDLQVVNTSGSPIGYGETKVPGSATEFAKTLESEQVTRYRASIQNLLVTDFIHFALFRADVGRLDVTLIETPGKMAAGSHAVSEPVLLQCSQMLSAFFSASAPSATSAEQLADGLARRATLLRDAIRTLIGSTLPDGEALRRLWDFYKRSLMSDMTADDFADTYAQTLMYALFLTRLEKGPLTDLDAAWNAIPTDVPIMKSAIEPLRAAGKIPDPLAVWLEDSLHLLAATPNTVVQTIGHPSAGKADPILYFYEHFLAAYDKVERIKKGVYYTPRPLVDYLVRAVDDTLRASFGKPLGLADKDVRLLDPALGTGTFLLAGAQMAADETEAALGSGAVKGVLEDHVLRHFYGFELLPAPYTISHLKLALFARDRNVKFLDKRAQVFLTNTLGDPVQRADDGGLLAFFVPGLIEEAAAAERVKADQPILVVIGNPPWSATSHNKQPEIERLFDAWKNVDGRPGSAKIKDARIALNDDYLKFLRWAVWKVVEQPGGARHGIVAFVTNHGFINNRVHRGVRKALLDAFDEIYVFDLRGNQRLWVKGVVDEKVFPDVQQGVALTVLVRRDVESKAPAKVRYRSMRGTRDEKYGVADTARLADGVWVEVPTASPYWSYAPADVPAEGEVEGVGYETWPSVVDVFPISTSGIQSSHDDLVSDVTVAAVADKIRQVADPSIPDDVLKERHLITENDRWKWAKQRKGFTGFDESKVMPWLYRLFDRRYVYWDPLFVQWPRTKVMRHLLKRPMGLGGEHRLALVVQRSRPIATIATVARGPATAHVTGNWCHVYPFRLSDVTAEDGLLPASDAWRENLDATIVARLHVAYRRRPTVDEVAWYTFGVLSAPSYRSRFSASLAIDHPRIPFAADPMVFTELAKTGEELGTAHLLEATVAPDIRFVGSGTNAVDDVRYDDATNSVWVNASQSFTGVPLEAWTWGEGFRPLEHYLDERRGRRLDTDQIQAFQSAIHAVRECIRLGPALDAALDAVITDALDFTTFAAATFP
ncbi:MAG: N-6 DNA methylase [Chloroflexi bacterium]|nr:N-6 DNA methylase [Chloroflexota bacterium]